MVEGLVLNRVSKPIEVSSVRRGDDTSRTTQVGVQRFDSRDIPRDGKKAGCP